MYLLKCYLFTFPQVAATSMIYQLCFGSHRDIRQDEDFMKALDGTRKFLKFTKCGNPVDVMPWLRHVMPGLVTTFLEFVRSRVARRVKKVFMYVFLFREDKK